jgi:NTE family protein
MNEQQIGLALSGGGYRALVFHLGVLTRLAYDDLLEQVSFVSTVSGGSLGIALVYAMNDYHWPSSQQFLNKVIPSIRSFLSKHNLERQIYWRFSRRLPTWLKGQGGNLLSELLVKEWGIAPSIQVIADHPRWIINASTYETRKNWRFSSRRMGDYQFGYSESPDILLADAVAASAAYPLIGALELDTTLYKWVRYIGRSQTDKEPISPSYSKLLLWDGAVYDNLGTEALTNLKNGLRFRKDLDFLIVSDASRSVSYPAWNLLAYFSRLYDITANQTQSLRTRLVMDAIVQQPTTGRYIKLGHDTRYILGQAQKHEQIEDLCQFTLTKEQIKPVSDIDTRDSGMPPERFNSVLRHGFEVANATLYAHGSDDDGFNFKSLTAFE